MMYNICMKNCLQCHQDYYFRKYISTKEKVKSKFCSKICYWTYKKDHKYYLPPLQYKESLLHQKFIIKKCLNCTFLFRVSRYSVGKFCSNSCYGFWRQKNLQKDKHWNWKGGITNENKRIHQLAEHKEWSQLIIKRDRECQICGDKKGHNLQANHIKKFCDYVELRLEPTNGIALCKTCHISIVTGHEKEWESYFNFNLMTRGYLLR